MRAFKNTATGFIVFAFFSVIAAALILMAIYKKQHSIKGGAESGMFEMNSASISLYYKDELVLTVTGGDREKLVKSLKKINMTDCRENSGTEGFDYRLDCNNDWGIVYINREIKSCYLKNDFNKIYSLPSDAYDFIFNTLSAGG